MEGLVYLVLIILVAHLVINAALSIGAGYIFSKLSHVGGLLLLITILGYPWFMLPNVHALFCNLLAITVCSLTVYAVRVVK